MLRDWTTTVVKCYGCGSTYDADAFKGGLNATNQHTRHTGDSGMSREQILELLAQCQAERDDWIRTAFGVEG